MDRHAIFGRFYDGVIPANHGRLQHNVAIGVAAYFVVPGQDGKSVTVHVEDTDLKLERKCVWF